ncbi:cation transporter, partial [Oenococcus oeni]|uniref:cation transporter n=1 Tax=Oenococcus oeni TaxID=1247 RepID=UPI000B1AA705
MDQESFFQRGKSNNKYWCGISINLLFIVFEVRCSFIAGSLELVLDAIHNLVDVLGLVIAFVAVILI